MLKNWGIPMSLSDLTDRNAVLQAIAEFDQLGRDAFLASTLMTKIDDPFGRADFEVMPVLWRIVARRPTGGQQ